MEIPQSFDCVNRTYTVELHDSDNMDDHGEVDPKTAIIKLRECTDMDFLEHTFIHECVHVVAGALGLEDIDKDEAKVDAIAGVVHQIIKTAEGAILEDEN